MKETSTIIVALLVLACLSAGPAQAELKVKVAPPKLTGQKAVIRLTMKNTYPGSVESARATVFLSDEQGKVVGQATRWVIGGTKDRPALEPDQETTFHFVVPVGNSASTNLQSRVLFNRVVLSGGRLADVTKEVIVERAGK